MTNGQKDSEPTSSRIGRVPHNRAFVQRPVWRSCPRPQRHPGSPDKTRGLMHTAWQQPRCGIPRRCQCFLQFRKQRWNHGTPSAAYGPQPTWKTESSLPVRSPFAPMRLCVFASLREILKCRGSSRTEDFNAKAPGRKGGSWQFGPVLLRKFAQRANILDVSRTEYTKKNWEEIVGQEAISACHIARETDVRPSARLSNDATFPVIFSCIPWFNPLVIGRTSRLREVG